MSVNAVRNPYAQTITPRPVHDPRTGSPGVGHGRPSQVQEQATPASLTPLARPAAQAAERALPAEAPAGVDAELWSVLTADERAFFAKAGQSGPLTYGRATVPGAAAAASAPVALRGGRLDVRA